MGDYDAKGNLKVVLRDLTGNAVTITGGALNVTAGTTSAPSVTRLEDGASTTLATIQAFHNADAQALGAGNGLYTGGVGLLLEPGTNGTPGVLVDRQRMTGADGIAAAGVAAAAQQLAGPPITTTFGAGGVTGNAAAQSILVGSSTNMLIGDVLLTQDNPEYVEVTAIVDTTHCTGIFKNNHAAGQSLTWTHYNQGRDVTLGDAAAGTGIAYEALAVYNGSTYDRAREVAGDAQAVTGIVAEHNMLYNGASYDRNRNNVDNITIAASASRNSTFTSADLVNYNARGVYVTLDITVNAGATAINTLTFQMKDPVSGKYVTILTSAALSAVATTLFTIYPGATVAANLAVSVPLGRTWRVVSTYSGSGSATYSIGASYIL